MSDLVRQHEHKAEKMDGDVNVVPIFAIVVGFLVFVCIACAVLAVIYYKVAPAGPYPNAEDFPAPQLHAHVFQEWYREVGGQIEDLHSYGWIDEQKGIAHIPIARAMKRIRQRKDPYAPLATAPNPPGSASAAGAAQTGQPKTTTQSGGTSDRGGH